MRFITKNAQQSVAIFFLVRDILCLAKRTKKGKSRKRFIEGNSDEVSP